MESTAVAVLSRREGLLEKLGGLREGFVFGSSEILPEAGIAIADREQVPLLAASGRYLARIILDSRLELQDRDVGDYVVAPEEFEANPLPSLLVCRDLAKARKLVAQLLGELEFSQHVQELVAIADFDAVSERITHTVLHLLEASAGTLLLHDPRIERFVVAFTNDPDFRDDGNFVPGVPADLLEEALAAQAGYAESAGERPNLILPIQAAQDLIGVLSIGGRRSGPFGDELAIKALRYVQGVTAVLGNLYQLTRSNELAMRDDLTKAYNRRFFEAYLEEEIERSRRYGTFFSIIFLDLDDLKRVNNLYGHLAGSRTLQEVAKRILSAVRAIDKVVRFGGDEFCIILPQTDQEQARSVANRVRRAVVESAFRIEPEIQIEITASFGIATFPIHATTKEDLIRQADAAMYRVKATTKNSVGMAEVRTPARRQA